MSFNFIYYVSCLRRIIEIKILFFSIIQDFLYSYIFINFHIFSYIFFIWLAKKLSRFFSKNLKSSFICIKTYLNNILVILFNSMIFCCFQTTLLLLKILPTFLSKFFLNQFHEILDFRFSFHSKKILQELNQIFGR